MTYWDLNVQYTLFLKVVKNKTYLKQKKSSTSENAHSLKEFPRKRNLRDVF